MPGMNSSLQAGVPAAGEQSEVARRRRSQPSASTRVLPREAILFRHEDTAPYECDGLTAYRISPLAVVNPGTEAEGGGSAQDLS